ncbi:MAG TPA: DUF1311 domain-containing protein [Fibrobacteria bacterium]|nr:DUF1311 domain-containing protein [Fibrobacteria bacterium]HOX52992.1 DUF1311 domain-containing protein [Fibrobacteria bacterium]
MHHSRTPFLLLLAGLATVSFAGEKSHPLDVESDRCLQEATTTLAMLDCHASAYQAWDERLNKVYPRVRGHLDSEGKKELLAAQREWLKFRDAQAQWTNNAFLKMEGSIHRVGAASARVQVVRQRVLELEQFLEIVEEQH